MCSILFSTKNNYKNYNELNYYLKFRGPDYTSMVEINEHLYIHNLLSITGEFKTQPFYDDDIVLIYNGEIYNYRDFGNYNTDGECIIPLYKEFGTNFIKKLDGEFAICLVDYRKKIVLISTDTFKTKPLFIGIDNNNISCSTYKQPLQLLDYKQIFKAKPNTYYVFNLDNGFYNSYNIYDFDLKQFKDNYDDWINSFRKSIIKRVSNTNKNIFIGLSSGYDSGLIHSELIKTNTKCFTYTLIGSENDYIINQRILSNSDNIKSKIQSKNDDLYINSHNWIKKTTEPFLYTIRSGSSNYNEFNTLLINDYGSNNFATICKMAIQDKCVICLSGTGADEIISDYGFNNVKIYNHSTFGGYFPEDLKSIFPWPSFYESTMESYIAKEEYVGGSFGIEMRYPFLDREVVQEFLWLKQELKNKEYKAPIDYYFNKFNIPYEKGIKRGF